MTEETRAALEHALRHLKTSDRYEAEVRQRLSKYPATVVEEVIATLKAKRMIDDVRTTEYAVEANSGRRAVGAHLLREKLERRGAPEDVVTAVASFSGEEESAKADGLLAAKFPTRNPEDRAKAGRFLFGRGFDEEIVESRLTKYFGDVE